MKQPIQKTWKREHASALLLFLAGLFVWGIWQPGAGEAARYLTTPVFIFAGGAFGLDAMAKQFGAPE